MSSGYNSDPENNFKKRVLDILSFSYPRYRFFTVLIVLIILFLIPVSYLGIYDFSICHHVLGKYCYSSGISRGVSSLLKGNLEQALDYNPLSILVLTGLFILLLEDYKKIKNKKKEKL